MKTVGIIGGMSWESSQSYYRLLNQKVNARLGGLHSAKVILYSVDFADIEPFQRHDQWQQAADALCKAARALESAGADAIVIATNTMHKVAPEVSEAVSIPLLHIVDATAQALKDKKLTEVGLLGTRFTMEQDFYRQRLQQHGIDVLIPPADTRQQLHDIIFDELCKGGTNETSKQHYCDAITALAHEGAQAVILGCTEIGLLVKQSDVALPLFDTTEIHVGYAVDWALNDA